MSLTENSNQVFLPGDANNSQNSPYISIWPLDQFDLPSYSLDLSPIDADCSIVKRHFGRMSNIKD